MKKMSECPLLKNKNKNTVALFIWGLSLGASWLLEHLWSNLWKESNDEILINSGNIWRIKCTRSSLTYAVF